MPQYIVLFPISPEQGPLIMPAEADRNAPDLVPPPVLVDETIISAEAAPILIEQGVIAPYAPPALPTSDPDPIPDAPAAKRSRA